MPCLDKENKEKITEGLPCMYIYLYSICFLEIAGTSFESCRYDRDHSRKTVKYQWRSHAWEEVALRQPKADGEKPAPSLLAAAKAFARSWSQLQSCLDGCLSHSMQGQLRGFHRRGLCVTRVALCRKMSLSKRPEKKPNAFSQNGF